MTPERTKIKGQQKNMAADRPIPGVVHLPRWFRTLGFWGGGICLVPALSLFWILPGFALFWAVLASCFGGLILACRNWCVLYDEDGFETVNALGISRRYGYREVCGIRGKGLYLRQQEKDRVLTIPMGAVGRKEFLDTLHKKYRQVCDGKTLPLMPVRERRDIFGGNVKKPGQKILLGVLGLIFPLMFVVMGAGVALHGYTAENTTPVDITLDRCWVDGDDLWLDAQEYDHDFRLTDYADMGPEGLCAMASWGKDTELQVYVTAYRQKNDIYQRYEIQCLTDAQGRIWFTFQQATARFQAQGRTLLFVAGLFLLLWCGFCGFVVYVGRHPERFKPKTVYRFFKKNTIIWKGCFKDGTN